MSGRLEIVGATATVLSLSVLLGAASGGQPAVKRQFRLSSVVIEEGAFESYRLNVLRVLEDEGG
jgi:hypothetical protein